VADVKQADSAFAQIGARREDFNVQAPDGTEGLEMPAPRMGGDDDLGEMREEIRKVIIEELRSLFMGS